MNILIIEDESIVAMEIEYYVTKLGYHVVNICSNSYDAIKSIKEKKSNIVLMDICLKGPLDGIETAVLIKAYDPKIEVIFLTAHLDEYNIDRAIELDPVAYLTKPFHREELRASLKIAEHKLKNKVIKIKQDSDHFFLDDEFCYRRTDSTLFCCEELIHLTKKEKSLLKLLIENKNHIVDFYTIENFIWPEKSTTANTRRTLIKRLREKIKYKFIQTVSSQGYRFVVK